jgi:alkylated DNA repair dioxygenase AlkB
MIDHLLDEAANRLSNMHLNVPPEFMIELKAIKGSRDGPIGRRREIFNYCLLNHYRDGEEYMSYHTDDESSLHPYFPIASVSFGSTRSFDIRPRKKEDAGKKSRVDRIPLGDGDLLVMFPPMQDYYEHGIPVEKRALGDRINLTFRRVK